jgi:hypothetical protein
MCLTRAFLSVPIAFSNVISEHFKHWKSPDFPKSPMLLRYLSSKVPVVGILSPAPSVSSGFTILLRVNKKAETVGTGLRFPV